MAQINQSEAQKNQTIDFPGNYSANPWLRFNGWGAYFQGKKFDVLTPLIFIPLTNKPIWEAIKESLSRVITKARGFILSHQLNIFDQKIINWFQETQTKHDLPLFISCQDNTYKRYQTKWLKLLAFSYRFSQLAPDSEAKSALKGVLTPNIIILGLTSHSFRFIYIFFKNYLVIFELPFRSISYIRRNNQLNLKGIASLT